MSALALEALAAAEAAGVTITLDGDGLILEANPAPSRPSSLCSRGLSPSSCASWRAGRPLSAAFEAQPPSDCSEPRWAMAQYGLQHFVKDGWGDPAALMGWTTEELYRVPPVWSRVDLTGAALLIGDRKVVAVTEASIAIETRSGIASQVSPDRAGAYRMNFTDFTDLTHRTTTNDAH